MLATQRQVSNESVRLLKAQPVVAAAAEEAAAPEEAAALQHAAAGAGAVRGGLGAGGLHGAVRLPYGLLCDRDALPIDDLCCGCCARHHAATPVHRAGTEGAEG